jgi:hypothetical protein
VTEQPTVRITPALPLETFESLSPPPLDRKELVVAWFGRLVAVKNVPLLIEVAEQAMQAVPGSRFVIVGDGPERSAVKSLVERSSGRIEYLAGQHDTARVLDRADVVIQTSLDEGTPIALIQGMAAARPFISTAVGGVPEMVTGEERVADKAAWFTNGVLVAPEASSFIAVLREFAQDRALLSKLGITGRQWALANYADTKKLDATHLLYSEYLSAKDRRLAPPLPPKLAGEFAMTQQLTRLAEKTGSYSEAGRDAALAINPDCATNTNSPPCNTDAKAGQSVPTPPASASPSSRTPDAPRCESQNRRPAGRSDAAARTSGKSGRSKRPRRAPE